MRITFVLLSLVWLSMVCPAPTNGQTITDFVAQSGGEFDQNLQDYDILLTAVVAADLTDALDDQDARLTVFAPNDNAFVRTARELGYDAWQEEGAWEFLVATLTEIGNGDPIPPLRAILLYHVVGEQLKPWQVIFSREIETLQGEVIRPRLFELRDQDTSLSNAFLSIPLNIYLDNGIIHTVTRVLIPFPNMQPTVTEVVAQSGGEFDQNFLDYDILLNAVITADLADVLSDPELDVTVFAPNDFAFIRTARDLGYDGWSEQGAWEFLVDALTELGGGDPVPLLKEILLYHVVPERLRPWQFMYGNQTLETLQGGTIRPRFFRLVDNEPDLPDPTLFIPVNIHASNGIIHSIGRVLIPFDLP